MFGELLLLLASCGPIPPGDGGGAEAPGGVQLKTLEQLRREGEAINRKSAETDKRTDELLKSLGLTLPKVDPVPFNLLPNVPKE